MTVFQSVMAQKNFKVVVVTHQLDFNYLVK